MEKRFLYTEQAAKFPGLSVAQLEKARTQGRDGPTYIKLPGIRRVLYDQVALINWATQGQRENTSQPE